MIPTFIQNGYVSPNHLNAEGPTVKEKLDIPPVQKASPTRPEVNDKKEDPYEKGKLTNEVDNVSEEIANQNPQNVSLSVTDVGYDADGDPYIEARIRETNELIFRLPADKAEEVINSAEPGSFLNKKV